MSGCSAFSVSSAARTPSPTSTSPAPRAARDLEADHRLAVEQRGRALLGDRVADVRDLVEPDAPAVATARSPSRPARRPTARCAIVRTDCSAPPTSVRPPDASCCIWRSWREMSAAVAFSASRRAGSSSTRTSRVDAADARRPRRRRAPPAGSCVTVLSTNQDSASSSMRVGRDRVGQDRRAGEVELGDDRVAQVGRQVGAHARDGVAHVVDRFLRRLLEAELDRDRGGAVLHLGVDVLDALQRGDRVLDLARDVGLELRRRGARQRRGDGDRRQVDVGEVLDLHRLEGQQRRRA